MNLIITLAFCILISSLFTFLAKKLRISGVVALIVAGILIGSSYIKDILMEPNIGFIMLLGNVGLLSIMMGVTAEASKAKKLMELKKIKTKLGTIILGAGIIDDIIAMVLFTAVCCFFVGIVALEESLLLTVAVCTFFTGVFVHRFIGRKYLIIKFMERFMLLFIIPFFFCGQGNPFQSADTHS